ncbi:SAM-dependent methyltransferase [Actinomadura sp. HBU206391]|nr:SAM-dependent methyltransferase [Actinomadura sp. HBU206391]
MDRSAAHPARVYDRWLGGTNNFAVDREAADRAAAANPQVVPAVRANRAFLGRAVRYLTGDRGIRQFLDIGTGIPTKNNTHGVAQGVAPDSRIVYVDNDPIVLAHARKLLKGSPEGVTAYISGDLHDPGKILQEAARTLDFTEPVAVMLVAVLQYISDDRDPYGIVAQLLEAAAPGSALVVSHPASDIGAEKVSASMQRYNEKAAVHATPRTHQQIVGFFDGTDLLEPGVVQLPQWPGGESEPDAPPLPMWCGVGHKPNGGR